MMAAPERSPERDAALRALLERVPTEGWTMSTLRHALADIGAEPLDAELLFPGGVRDLIEAFIDLADREMPTIAEGKLPERVRAVIAARFAWLRPHREAVRRAMAILALPGHARLVAACTARTVDAIWHAAGDRSADFAWYTKRFILAGIYGATMLAWLRDPGDDDAATLAFLDRRLAGHARFHRLQNRIEGMFTFKPCRRNLHDQGGAAA